MKDDLINRWAAIDAMCDACKTPQAVCAHYPCGHYLAIEGTPSAQPERQKGEWARNFDGNEWYWFCSNCKEEWYEEDLWMGGNDFPNFCPNCGADMRGEQDE